MANTWTNYRVKDTDDRVIELWTVTSDATQETDKILVDKSALSGTFTKLAVLRIWIQASDQDADYLFEYDATTDDEIAYLGGGTGALIDLDLRDTDGIVDPVSAGNTGDILLTTTGLSNTYKATIIIEARKVP